MDVTGYVNVTARDSRPIRDRQGLFIEQIAPGAFAHALTAGNPVELRFNHRQVLGSTEDVLQLREDNIGLKAHAVVTDPAVIAKAEAGELRGWSIGFIKKADEWTGEGDGRRRVVSEMELREVSILDKTPAYIATSIETRGEEDLLIEYRVDTEPLDLVQARAQDPEPEPAPEDTGAADIARKRLELEKHRRRDHT